LKIGVILAAGVDNVPASVDLPVIEQEWLVDRAVALDKKTQTLALAEQSAGGQKGNLYRDDLARLQPFLVLKLLNRLPGSRERATPRMNPICFPTVPIFPRIRFYLNICYASTSDFRKGSQKHRERVTQGKEMAETVDEITIDWTDENGQQLVRQLKKEILTSGAWSTIMFLYQDFDKKAGDWGPKKIRVVRYQKRGGKYIPQSKFNVSSAKQARQIIANLQNWLPEMDNQVSSEDFNGNSNVKA
jgi:hypothetical protein